MKKNSILPACVYYKGVPMGFVQSLIKTYKAMSNLLPLQAETGARINAARTRNGKAFLESEAEWIFLIDTDMYWEPTALIKLYKTAKEKKLKVISGLTFIIREDRIFPHAFAWAEQVGRLAPMADLPYWDRPFTVDAAGGACLLVHREVYEAVARITKGTTEFLWQDEKYNPKADINTGEDIVFCDRIKAAGYDIWYHPEALFGHERDPRGIGAEEYLAQRDSLMRYAKRLNSPNVRPME